MQQRCCTEVLLIGRWPSWQAADKLPLTCSCGQPTKQVNTYIFKGYARLKEEHCPLGSHAGLQCIVLLPC